MIDFFDKRNIVKQKVNTFTKKGIIDDYSLIHYFPKKYYDFTNQINVTKATDSNYHLVIGKLLSIVCILNGKRIYTKAKLKDNLSGKDVTILWFNNSFLAKQYKHLVGKDFAVGGIFTYNNGYQIISPIIFTPDISGAKCILSQYRIPKTTDSYFLDKVKLVFEDYEEKDPLPTWLLNKYNLLSRMDALKEMHMPKSMETIRDAQKRLILDDLLYFSIALKKRTKQKEGLNFPNKDITEKLINSLPYKLTEDQEKAFNSIYENINEKQTNALVQGDVGCGKTIVSFLLMFLAAENGYQATLMAPTVTLATQHYEELKNYAEKYNFTVAFLGGKQPAKEKREILKGIKNGCYNFVVGTHSLTSENIEFNKLGLIITDEEHKFGVNQRESLMNKALEGCHNIIMSATPIPRSLASSIYENLLEIYDIKSMPNGRKPIITSLENEDKIIFEKIEEELKKGHQAYVVCPLIEKSEDGSKMEQITSVQETEKIYKKYFEKKGYNVATVTGQTKPDELEEIFNLYKNNDIQILISTTVIEVGINVPNSTIIVINNAERFGLASLHQLRGRVGRNSLQSYCILNAQNEAERLQVMCRTNNGFEIAEADLSNRGCGDLLGVKQSGDNYYINLIMLHPEMFKSIKKIAKVMMERGEDKDIWEERNLSNS